VQAPVAAQTLAQAHVQWQTAEAQQQRQTQLLAQGFVGPASWDEVTKAAQLAKAQYQSAHQQWQALQPEGVEVLGAQVAIDQALAAAQAARVRLDYAVIRSPVAGFLMARTVEPGNQVQPGKLLMTLSPKGRTQLVVAIDEKNLHLLRLGQSAWASADAYPQQRVAATLVYINPAVNPQTGAVEVKLDVAHPPANWMQDMTVSVDIQVERRNGVVVTALHNVHDKDTSPWVLQWVQGLAVRQEVQLGLLSAGFAEVVRGVVEGDRLIPSTAPATAGQLVRVATP
jgi:HlyD family secretion protein